MKSLLIVEFMLLFCGCSADLHSQGPIQDGFRSGAGDILAGDHGPFPFGDRHRQNSAGHMYSNLAP